MTGQSPRSTRRVGLLDGQSPTLLGELVRASRLPVSGVLEHSAPVYGIAWDSRAVQAGDLFVALPGGASDGHRFAADAVARGAVAVVAERPVDAGAPTVIIDASRLALSGLAAAFYDHPARTLTLVGVTGTDGKTTTVHLAAAALAGMGMRTSCVSTLAFETPDATEPNQTDMTTPEAPVLHRFLAEQVRTQVDACILETTSHGLAQRRLADCRFDIAAVTNLTPEHLDFHGSFEEYAAAKLEILGLLRSRTDAADPVLVLHADDPELDRFRGAWLGPRREYAIGGDADVVARDVSHGRDTTLFRLCVRDDSASVRLSLIGSHNLLNALGAAAIGTALGGCTADIARGLEASSRPRGRLEPVDCGQDFAVFVDFAHTPNAVAQVLQALRPLTQGRLLVVVGSAGGRDSAKRPAIGRAVARHADAAVLTTDDPRDEDPAAIATDIAAGLRAGGWREGREYRTVIDRSEAIRSAIAVARQGDTVLIAGKGGQSVMYLGSGTTMPWNDVDVASAAVEALARTGGRALSRHTR